VIALNERQFKATLLGAFILLSWAVLWAWSQTHHGQHSHQPVASILPVLFFAAGWTLMTVAMMLPTTFPLLGLFHAMIADRRHSASLIGLCITGYLIAWVSFGILAYFGMLWLQPLASASNFQAALLAIAGVYQFTPLKHYCLRKCRSPMSFILGHWHGKNEAIEAFWLGAHHGLFCIGCCWSLMLLMFAVSSIHFLWMLALGTVMAIEKNVSWGGRMSTPIGVLLLIAAVVVKTS